MAGTVRISKPMPVPRRPHPPLDLRTPGGKLLPY